jgi:hypothetical protein
VNGTLSFPSWNSIPLGLFWPTIDLSRIDDKFKHASLHDQNVMPVVATYPSHAAMGSRPLEAAFHLRPVQYERPHRLAGSGGLGTDPRSPSLECVVAVKFIFAAALLRIAEASAKERLRFIGDWSGSPATCKEPFRFTPSRYIAPSGFALTYESIERSDNRFSLKFPDGSGINLAVVKPQRMTWHSPRPGDTFDLRRCEVETPVKKSSKVKARVRRR